VANLVALVSVLSGAAVAIGVPWITSSLERRRLREQVAEARIDELRSVFDEAAIALDQAVSVLPTWEVIGQDERGEVTVYAESRKALEAVSAQAERLAIRVGESSPIFTGYDNARLALWKLHHGLISNHMLKKIPGMVEGELPDPRTNARFIEGRRVFRKGAQEMLGA
jgi:hypothetical protein